MAAVDEMGVARKDFSSGHLDPKVWKVIAVVLLGPFMTQMDSTVVNVSLPISSPRAFLIPFVALIGLQLLVLGSASRLPVRIHYNEP